jgi:4-amino-4-deoxy-L-arabinose transferase-like glycosyltransferase
LVAGLGHLAGGVNETIARLPSALAAIGLVYGAAVLAARHYGPGIGLLAGAIQATTAWTVMRGRLAEADILLACLITWAIVALDRVGDGARTGGGARWHAGCWAFFALLGVTSLVKGIGFGAVLILAVVAAVLLWQRDGATVRRLCFPAGWALAAVLAMAWPLLMVASHGFGSLALWTMHVTDRLAAHPGQFAGESGWHYALGILAQALPWTPLALIGAWRSLGRAVFGGGDSSRPGRHQFPRTGLDGDRLLWAWTIMPLALLSLATVKNAHYAIAAQVPWSIWAALVLARLGEQLRWRGWNRPSLLRGGRAAFTAIALAYGLGYWLLGPSFDRRGVEWAFYESAARRIDPAMPLTLLYDDWDRNPYESPFGLIPHDLGVRLFYLGRPAAWDSGPDKLVARVRAGGKPEFAVIGRDRDLPSLERLGQVEVIARGPALRFDRTYSLFRVTSRLSTHDTSIPVANAENPGLQR